MKRFVQPGIITALSVLLLFTYSRMRKAEREVKRLNNTLVNAELAVDDVRANFEQLQRDIEPLKRIESATSSKDMSRRIKLSDDDMSTDLSISKAKESTWAF